MGITRSRYILHLLCRAQNSTNNLSKSRSLYGFVMYPSMPTLVARRSASSVTSALTASTVGPGGGTFAGSYFTIRSRYEETRESIRSVAS